MRYQTLRDTGIMAFLWFGILGIDAGRADAQLLGRRRVTVQETVAAPPAVVAPPPVVVEPSRVKVRRNKVVVKQKRGVLARVPAVITSTPVVTKSRVVESPPVAEERVVQPSRRSGEADIELEPTLESPVIEPDPVIKSRSVIKPERVIQPDPVIESRVVPLPR